MTKPRTLNPAPHTLTSTPDPKISNPKTRNYESSTPNQGKSEEGGEDDAAEV